MSKKRFGLRFNLPEGDPMRQPHLLGEDWEAYRWYDTEGEREQAYEAYRHEHEYSRRGDVPSLVITKVER